MAEAYSFTRYLTAKKSVDDRALNPHVWDRFAGALRERQKAAGPGPNILEVGAGTGTMIERFLAQGLLTGCEYVAVDAEQANIEAALARLPREAARYGYDLAAPASLSGAGSEGRSSQLGFERDSDGAVDAKRVLIVLESADVYDFAARPKQQQRYDVLIAHAFLDLLDVPRALAHLSRMLRTRALLYLTINFDGATILEPAIDLEFDALVERRYHETMDRRIVAGRPSGDSLTGRHLFGHLRNAGMDIIAAGSLDWVVYAGPDGYVDDEAFFLHFIVETIRGALANDPQLDADRFQAWIRRRHDQIDDNELVYIAHQLDFMARKRA